MMFSQASIRNQRPKGFKVKQAFQVALFVAVFIWLLYQINHSYNKGKDYGENQNKVNEIDRSTLLGRKGNAGSHNEVEIDPDNENSMREDEKKEENDNGDDELGRNSQGKEEGEFFPKEGGNNEENEDEKDPETKFEELHRNEDNIDDTRIMNKEETLDSDNDKGHGDSQENLGTQFKKVDQNESKTQNNGQRKNEEGHSDEGVSENKGSKETAEEIVLNTNGTVNTTISDQNEMGNGVNGFHDENGVPQNGRDHENSVSNDTKISDQAMNVHQKTVSSSDNQNGTTGNIISKAEDFLNSSQVNGQNYTEISNGSHVLGLGEVKLPESINNSVVETASNKKDATTGTRTSSESGTNLDSLNTDGTSPRTHEDGIVSGDSSFVPSKQEKEEVSGLKMLPSTENGTDSNE